MKLQTFFQFFLQEFEKDPQNLAVDAFEFVGTVRKKLPYVPGSQGSQEGIA